MDFNNILQTFLGCLLCADTVLGLGVVNETKARTLHSKSICSALSDINHSNIFFFDPFPAIMEITKINRTYLNSKTFAEQRKQ